MIKSGVFIDTMFSPTKDDKTISPLLHKYRGFEPGHGFILKAPTGSINVRSHGIISNLTH